MSEMFVLPTLTRWTENSLSAMLKATTKEEYDQAFDRFLARNAQVTVNGIPIAREEYKQRMLDVSAAGSIVESVELRFDAAVEQQSNGKSVSAAPKCNLGYRLLIDWHWVFVMWAGRIRGYLL